jgi:hypothetical protein
MRTNPLSSLPVIVLRRSLGTVVPPIEEVLPDKTPRSGRRNLAKLASAVYQEQSPPRRLAELVLEPEFSV